MSEIEITDDDIEAVTDPAVCRLADTIVLRNQGCGNASVLIDRFVKQVRREARAEALEEAAKVAEDFAAAMNAIRAHPDPLPIDTNEGWRRVMDGAIDVATAIRALRSGEREG